MKESDIESYFVSKCRAIGALVRKAKWIGVDGCPDRCVFYAGRTWWVELKRPGGAAKFPSDARERTQLRRHEEMRAQGVEVALIDSKQGVDEWLTSITKRSQPT